MLPMRDKQQLKIELLSQWKLEAESRNYIHKLNRTKCDFQFEFNWHHKSRLSLGWIWPKFDHLCQLTGILLAEPRPKLCKGLLKVIVIICSIAFNIMTIACNIELQAVHVRHLLPQRGAEEGVWNLFGSQEEETWPGGLHCSAYIDLNTF